MTTTTDGAEARAQLALECLLNRDAEGFRAALAAGVEPDSCPGDQTLLQWACTANAPEFAVVLLDAGADPNNRGIDAVTPLMAAAFTGNAAMIGSLLDAGADVVAADGGGRTALMFAARSGQPAAVQRLLDAGASAGDADDEGKNSLHWAMLDGDYQGVVQVLLAAGTDSNADAGGHTPLQYARLLRRERCATLLAAEQQP